MEPWARDLSAGSPCVWVVSSKCPSPPGNNALCFMDTRGQDLAAKHLRLLNWRETQPEVDIAIAPPAGSLEKDSEIHGLAVN